MADKRGSSIRNYTVSISAAVLLAACESQPIGSAPASGGATASAAEQSMRREAAVFNKSGLQACATAGGVTGVISYLLWQDERKALYYALAGCGVGVGANYYLQQRRQDHADHEQRMDIMIADVRKDNERLSNIIQSAEQVIAEDTRTIEQIEQSYQSQQITLVQAREQMRAVDGNRAYLEQTLANLQQRETQWLEVAQSERSVQSPADMTLMDEEIVRLQEQIATLETDLDILVNRRSVSPIG